MSCERCFPADLVELGFVVGVFAFGVLVLGAFGALALCFVLVAGFTCSPSEGGSFNSPSDVPVTCFEWDGEDCSSEGGMLSVGELGWSSISISVFCWLAG